MTAVIIKNILQKMFFIKYSRITKILVKILIFFSIKIYIFIKI